MRLIEYSSVILTKPAVFYVFNQANGFRIEPCLILSENLKSRQRRGLLRTVSTQDSRQQSSSFIQWEEGKFNSTCLRSLAELGCTQTRSGQYNRALVLVYRLLNFNGFNIQDSGTKTGQYTRFEVRDCSNWSVAAMNFSMIIEFFFFYSNCLYFQRGIG